MDANSFSRNVGSQNLSIDAQEVSFQTFFWAITSFFFSAFLLLSKDFDKLIEKIQAAKADSSQDKIIQVLLENKESAQGRKDTVKFLSDKTSNASGNITREKGFESISSDHVLQMGKVIHEKSEKSAQASRLLKNDLGKSAPQKKPRESRPSAPELRIPAHYQFRHDFAFTWDYAGRPVIPTVAFEHYSYFRSMINKIQNVWAPPGGDPYPTFGDEYHRMNYAAGYSRYTTFPSQDVNILFMLDINGNVLDVKMVNSLGFKSLDQSCVEAIWSAKNFGPPPTKLLSADKLIIPFTFRIIVR